MAQTLPPITRTECVPTASPTVAATPAVSAPPTVTATTTVSAPPSVAATTPVTQPPTVAATPGDCVSFTVSMTDSWGDGWNGNYLFFDAPEQMTTTAHKVTLSSGHSGLATLCLPSGSYSPFACGGSYKSEVGWTIEGHDISGGADNSCQPSSGSFALLHDGETLAPSPAPSPAPTVAPTAAPTFCPSQRTIVVHMTDTFGKQQSATTQLVVRYM